MKKALRLVSLVMVVVVMALALVSCGGPNADPDKALEALKEEKNMVAGEDKLLIPIALRAAGVDGVDTVISASGKIDDEYAHVTVVYFEEAEDAKEAWETVEKYAEDNKSKEAGDDWVCKQSGKMIYWGTKAAINAAK